MSDLNSNLLFNKDLHSLDNYKPKQNNDWQLHWLNDQPMLFSKSHDELHLLNPVAGFIWTCCDGKTNVRAIKKSLQEVFVKNQDDVAEDLPNILELWREQELIDFGIHVKNIDFQIYLVNVPREHERRIKCVEQFKNIGINPTIISAYDGHDPSFPFHKYKNLSGHDLWGDPKTFKPGAFACYLSHAECWKKIAGGNSPYGLIVEDDIIINRKFFENFSIGACVENFDIIFINSGAKRLINILNNVPEIKFVCLGEILTKVILIYKELPAVGAYGYIVSKKGATKLLNIMNEDRICMGVDLAMVLYSLDLENIKKLNNILSDKMPHFLQFLLSKISEEKMYRSYTDKHLISYVYTQTPLTTIDGSIPSTIKHNIRIGYDVFEK